MKINSSKRSPTKSPQYYYQYFLDKAEGYKRGKNAIKPIRYN